MKYKTIDIEKVQRAKDIMQHVAKAKEIPVLTMQSKSRKPEVTYARCLVIYFVFTQTTLQRDQLAELFGWVNQKKHVHYCYHKLRLLYNQDEKVRQEVISIEQQLKAIA
jgi:chromosomal replication initiation ATPase DnaA